MRSFHLELPLRDLELLPTELGCTLRRERGLLVVDSDPAGSSLTFEILGDRAVLVAVEIREDLQGRFTQRVLGTLLFTAEGDFDGVLTWRPARRGGNRLVIRGGETSHPLLTPLMNEVNALKHPQERPRIRLDESAVRVEAHLTTAREAWAEYQQLKASRDGQLRPKA